MEERASRSSTSGRVDKLIQKQLEMLNRHLAKQKRDLRSLLVEEKPQIAVRDGSDHLLRREELERIASILPAEEHGKLMLPIYIELNPSKYGHGTSRVVGGLECRVVAEILGKRVEGDILYLYRPEIKKLRREMATTTQYMFTPD